MTRIRIATMEDYSKPAAIDFQWMAGERWSDGSEIQSLWTRSSKHMARLVTGRSLLGEWGASMIIFASCPDSVADKQDQRAIIFHDNS
ncbi:MAG TPA: hypothetical protein VF732_09880, partial [Nitrospira sp.]